MAEEPNFRFYAGTPLTTESNINLGCLFVLDIKPHDEFTFLEKETMGHLGMLIIDFLKVSRQASEGHRAARLSHGLKCFVEGRSNFASDSQMPVAYDVNQTSSEARGLNTRRISCERSRSHSSGACLNDSASELTDADSVSSSFEPTHQNEFLRSRHRGDREGLQGNSWTFQRAANLIRESLELDGSDGVVFVGAGNDLMCRDGSDNGPASLMDSTKAVSVLSFSTEDSARDKEATASFFRAITNLDEVFLRRLLHRYHNGKIWSFHQDGLLYSSDSEEAKSSRRPRGRANPSPARAKAQKRKFTENCMLQKCFSGASQILFVPLWNTAHLHWFGGFFCWNTVESNVFNQSVELSSLLGFGSSIISECNRVDSLIAD